MLIEFLRDLFFLLVFVSIRDFFLQLFHVKCDKNDGYSINLFIIQRKQLSLCSQLLVLYFC